MQTSGNLARSQLQFLALGHALAQRQPIHHSCGIILCNLLCHIKVMVGARRSLADLSKWKSQAFCVWIVCPSHSSECFTSRQPRGNCFKFAKNVLWGSLGRLTYQMLVVKDQGHCDLVVSHCGQRNISETHWENFFKFSTNVYIGFLKNISGENDIQRVKGQFNSDIIMFCEKCSGHYLRP